MYNAEADLYSLSPMGKEVNKDYYLSGHLYGMLKLHQKQGLGWLWGCIASILVQLLVMRWCIAGKDFERSGAWTEKEIEMI